MPWRRLLSSALPLAFCRWSGALVSWRQPGLGRQRPRKPTLESQSCRLREMLLGKHSSSPAPLEATEAEVEETNSQRHRPKRRLRSKQPTVVSTEPNRRLRSMWPPPSPTGNQVPELNAPSLRVDGAASSMAPEGQRSPAGTAGELLPGCKFALGRAALVAQVAPAVPCFVPRGGQNIAVRAEPGKTDERAAPLVSRAGFLRA